MDVQVGDVIGINYAVLPKKAVEEWTFRLVM